MNIRLEKTRRVRDENCIIGVELDSPDVYLIKNYTYVKHTKKTKTRSKSKLPLVLSAGIASALIATSMLTMPEPFNYIIAIAICGPLSASIMGLKK